MRRPVAAAGTPAGARVDVKRIGTSNILLILVLLVLFFLFLILVLVLVATILLGALLTLVIPGDDLPSRDLTSLGTLLRPLHQVPRLVLPRRHFEKVAVHGHKALGVVVRRCCLLCCKLELCHPWMRGRQKGRSGGYYTQNVRHSTVEVEFRAAFEVVLFQLMYEERVPWPVGVGDHSEVEAHISDGRTENIG